MLRLDFFLGRSSGPVCCCYHSWRTSCCSRAGACADDEKQLTAAECFGASVSAQVSCESKKQGTRNRTFRTDHSARAFSHPARASALDDNFKLILEVEIFIAGISSGTAREVVVLRLIAARLAPALHLPLARALAAGHG